MRLNLKPGVETYTLFAGADGVPAITIDADPALTSVIEDAKADASLLEYADEMRGMVETGDEISAEFIKSRGRFGVLLAKAIARQVIVGWSGVEDADGSPAPVSPDRVDAFLDVPAIYDAFTMVYLGRWLTLQAEKNASAPSPTGTSAAARNTAGRARKSAKNAPAV